MFFRPDITQKGFIWYLSPRCNYRCPYCCYSGEEKSSLGFPYRLEDCLRFLDGLEDRWGIMQVSLTGGEPTLHPLFIPLLQHLSSRGHCVTVVSNLAGRMDRIIESISIPDRFRIEGSLHFQHTTAEKFLPKIRELHLAGINVNASVVMFPPFLDLDFAAGRLFRQELPEVYFGYHVFFGHWNGNYYPQSYSMEEAARIGEETGIDVFQRASEVNVSEMKCRTGMDFFALNFLGRVVRCQSLLGEPGVPWDEFEPAPEPIPCPLKECISCPDLAEFWVI